MVLECSGAASTGDIVSYEWRIVSMPPGTTRFEPSDEVLSTILIPTIGTYVLELVVWDSSGRRSDPGGDAVVRVVAEADDHIRVELTWETPTDPDPSDIGAGKGADVDLHFLHPAGCWSDDLWDCHFRSPRPDWGVPGTDRDDPDLDWDDTDGGGPEIVTFENPQDGNTYRIGVHYYNDHGFGTSFATVRVYLFGELVFATVDKELRAQDAWWVVAEIDWPSGEVTEIDDVSIGGVPMCSWAP